MSVHFEKNFSNCYGFCRGTNQTKFQMQWKSARYIYQTTLDNRPKPEGTKADTKVEGAKPDPAKDEKEKHDDARNTALGEKREIRADNIQALFTERLKVVDQNRKTKQADFDRLKATTGKLRSPLDWWGKTGSTKSYRAISDLTGEKSDVTIRREVDSNFENNQNIKGILEKFGMKNSQNDDLLKAVIFEVTSNYINSLDTKEKSEITSSAEGEIQGKMLKKVEKIFRALIAIAEEKDSQGKNTYGFDSPMKVLAAFSDFTGTNFIKDVYFQNDNNQLQDLFLQDEATCDAFVANFKKGLGFKDEIATLDAEEVDRKATLAKAQGEKPDIEAMIKAGTLKVPRTEIVIPAGVDEAHIRSAFENGIRTSLENGQKLENESTKLAAIAYFMAQFDTLNPKPAPGETYIFLGGKLKPNNAPEVKEAEVKAQVEAAATKAAAKTAAIEAAAKTPETSTQGISALGDFDFDGVAEKIAELIQKLIDWINNNLSGILGAAGVTKGVADLSKKAGHWTEYTDPEKKEVENFYKAAQTLSSKIPAKHLDALLKDPVAVKSVLNDKYKYGAISWDTYLNQHVEKGELKEADPLIPAEIASRITSKETPTTDTKNPPSDQAAE